MVRYSVVSSSAAPMTAHRRPIPTSAPEAAPDEGSCAPGALVKGT